MKKTTLFLALGLLAMLFVSGCGKFFTMSEDLAIPAGSSVKAVCTVDDWRSIQDDIDKKLQETGFRVVSGEEKADYQLNYTYKAFFEVLSGFPHWAITQFQVSVVDNATGQEIAKGSYEGSSYLGDLLNMMSNELKAKMK